MSTDVKINRGLKSIYFERSGVSHIDGAKGELGAAGEQAQPGPSEAGRPKGERPKGGKGGKGGAKKGPPSGGKGGPPGGGPPNGK